MMTDILWILVVVLVALYIIHLRIQLWLKDYVIRTMVRGPESQPGGGAGCILYALLLTLAAALLYRSCGA